MLSRAVADRKQINKISQVAKDSCQSANISFENANRALICLCNCPLSDKIIYYIRRSADGNQYVRRGQKRINFGPCGNAWNGLVSSLVHLKGEEESPLWRI